ncbi:MAG: hypothetical protein LKI93_00715 [Bifidobacteriaceae bacterium]|nr:hypothetical protein [Bifidobacteriaceae bacterium]MCI1915512.1 hypothetical protein [Bifidobacteriaceae bacterium]
MVAFGAADGCAQTADGGRLRADSGRQMVARGSGISADGDEASHEASDGKDTLTWWSQRQRVQTIRIDPRNAPI